MKFAMAVQLIFFQTFLTSSEIHVLPKQQETLDSTVDVELIKLHLQHLLIISTISRLKKNAF